MLLLVLCNAFVTCCVRLPVQPKQKKPTKKVLSSASKRTERYHCALACATYPIVLVIFDHCLYAHRRVSMVCVRSLLSTTTYELFEMRTQWLITAARNLRSRSFTPRCSKKRFH